MNNDKNFYNKLSQLQNTNNLPNLKYIKIYIKFPNKFPPRPHTAISRKNNNHSYS